jgi:signal transduction histidine kinase/DNA-binding response OmpR family regulator
MSNWVQRLIHASPEAAELLQSTSRTIIMTTGAIYLCWHFIATLVWPATFGASLWTCTLIMLAVFVSTMLLLDKAFYISQIIWFAGLITVILTAYNTYHTPEITLLFTLLPLMSMMMIGLRGMLVVWALTLILEGNLTALNILTTPLPESYQTVLIMASLAMGGLGWGLSGNLMSAIEASQYHHKIALERLEEARKHRAEVSVLLKEQSKANYQLDQLNKMLDYARARAEEARQDRDRFALAVSHELRSPLNFIIGFSDLIVNSPETYAPLQTWPPDLYEDVDGIYRSSKHLLSLINDILDMGKIDAHQMTLLKEWVKIRQVIQEVQEMVEPALSKKGLWLKVQVEKNLPVLYLDRTRIRQVLINLVTNAVRFTTKGGLTIRASRQDERTVRVEVEDTGSGISKQDLDKIFNEFRQAGTQNWTRNEGSGLGLSIGRRFVELHGGAIDVESEPGKGSLFWFTLPVQEPARALVDNSQGSTSESLSASLSGRIQPPVLLYLTANTLWAHMFAEALPGCRLTVLREPDRLEETFRQVYPQIVLIDQDLVADPLVQEFIQQPPYDLPVISVTAPVSATQKVELPPRVLSYLVKPVDRQTLVETILSFPKEVHRLLVVDDDPAMARLVTLALQTAESEQNLTADYQIIPAGSGSEALDYLESGQVDAMILDMALPDVDGFSLLDQWKGQDVPVVIISASDLPTAVTVKPEGTFTLRIHRPFTGEEVAGMVAAALQSMAPIMENKAK